MRAQPRLRNTWPVYARYIAMAVAIVAALALVQFLFVYGADQIQPRLLIIPVTVGVLFGFMLARMRLLRSQTDLLNTFVEATQARSDHGEAITHLLRVMAEQLRSDTVALYEKPGDDAAPRRLWVHPQVPPLALDDSTLLKLFTRAAQTRDGGICREHLLPGGKNRPGMVEAIGLALPDDRQGLLVLHRIGPQRDHSSVLEQRFLQLCADWLGMTLIQMHQQEVIAREREQSRREKERAQTTLESIGDAVVTTDREGNIDYANPVVTQLLGQRPIELTGQPLSAALRLEDEASGTPHPALLAADAPRDPEAMRHLPLQLRTRANHVRPVQLSLTPILNRPPGSLESVLVMRDISELREALHRLDYQATHDALTGLLNRAAFEKRLEDHLRAAHAHGTRHTLCYLDLDQFKVINDTRGHAVGDELLRQIARLLQSWVGEHDTLARLGGDEFGILLADRGIEAGQLLAEEIARALADFRFAWEGATYSLSASIGLVEVSAASESTRVILQQADTACYAVKDAGRNQVRVFHEEDVELRDRTGELHWVSGIPEAIEQDRFELWAQPVRNLTDDSDTYLEILLRLRDPDGGLVTPGAFIPAAERYDLMVQIDHWVVSRALAYMQGLQAGGTPLPVLGINLSGSSLNNDAFVDFLQGGIANAGIPGDRLCFEITETAAVHHLERTARLMTRLRTSGCRFALDDFGSGLSSFAYLKHLPVDYLKIDGHFVRDINRDPIDLAMVRAIHEVAQILGLETIAEHVEDASIRERLEGIGIRHGQGYGLARPAPLDGQPQAGAFSQSASSPRRSSTP
ncbi:EAL domain-containing protein [Thioalkalivibrio sp. ALJ16]|uniref:EAL domain-containing protein n=1 Tax=Thioalkalivibrio sp. ALJ16 TaxID=1158762 RepID=UPI0003707E40|nr:EAL domain-containing protein [Thioalkalivibrio sp. ALJ16]